MNEVDFQRYPVLYVDDEPSNLLVFEHALRDLFCIRTVDSGKAALELLEAERMAVVIADQRMPGMTGVELIEQLRARHPDTVRIILTAYVDPKDSIAAINRGEVWRFISKPWNQAELTATLRGAVELFALRESHAQVQLQLLRSERLALLGYLSATVAHDLKSPLSCAMMALSEIRRALEKPELSEPTTSTLRRFAEDGLSACRQILSLAEGVSVQARQSSRVQRVDMGALCESMLRLCRTELQRRGQVRFERELAVCVKGDPGQLGQVVLNLLLNAGQALPPEKRGTNSVALCVAVQNGRAMLEVSDNGEGISPEARSRMFEPFFTTKAERGGSGLGLAIVQSVVQKHQGEIEVESTPGQGSRFRVFLPLALETDGS